MRSISRAFFSCVLILLIIIATPAQARYDDTVGIYNNYLLAKTAFLQSDFGIQDIKIQAWGQISNKRSSLKELLEKYRQIVSELGYDQNKPAVQEEKDGFVAVSLLVGDVEGETLQVSLQSIPEPGKPKDGLTFLAVLFTTKSTVKAESVYGRLAPLLRSMGLKEPLGVTFSGYMTGLLNPGIRNSIVQELGNSVKAVQVEGIQTDNYTSRTCYSRLGQGFIELPGNKANLQLAVTSYEKEGRTWLYAGSPLIYQEY